MSAVPTETVGGWRSGRGDLHLEVLVVDPRPLFAHGIAAGFDDAKWQVSVVAPDAVPDLPSCSGIAMVAMASPDPAEVVAVLAAGDRRVIVYGSDEGPVFFEAVDAGAVGFVSDHAGTDEFREAAEAVRNGDVSVFPEHTRRRLADRDRPAADSGLSEMGRLTRREREVLDGLVAGLRPAEIAERDFVSATTVRNQVQSILTKLNVHSQLEAVATAHRLGWMLNPIPDSLDRPRFDAHAS